MNLGDRLAGLSALWRSPSRALLQQLWFLLFVLFAAVIVGENACESLLVTHLGYRVLPKMYMATSAMLFLFMPFVFVYIDRIERGRFLAGLVLASSCGVLLLGGLLWLSQRNAGLLAPSILALYLFSYLAKIILFIVFWTLANDVSDTRQSKSLFPLVASGGILGGMAGSVLARVLLRWVELDHLLPLWSLLLAAAFPLVLQIRKRNAALLQRSEFERRLHRSSAPAGFLRPVAGKRLVWAMGVLYFLVFVIIFNFDFQFARVLNTRFPTAESFADFRYKFYFFHSLVTTLFQWAAAGLLVRRFGIISTLAALPVFFSVAFGLWAFGRDTLAPTFAIVVVLQFFRQLLFESFFSPNYQVFFSSLRKEIRGRAKVLLEGVVKPSAIFFSGALLYLVHDDPGFLFPMLLVFALASGAILLVLRRQYLRSLLEGVVGDEGRQELIQKITDESRRNMLSLLNECARSSDLDLKRFAIAGLGAMGKREAFASLVSVFERGGSEEKEFTAKSLDAFSFEENKSFLLRLCSDPNPRVVANALFSLRQSAFKLDPDAVAAARGLLDHSELRVSIEAALLLWNTNELAQWTEIEERIGQWIDDESANVQAAAIYLIGQLNIGAWLPEVWKKVESKQRPVWTKAVDVLASLNSPEAWSILLDYLIAAPREREETLIRALGQLPPSAWGSVQDKFLQCQRQRALFSLVEVLRHIAVQIPAIDLRESVGRKLKGLLINELRMIYQEIYCLLGMEEKYGVVPMDLLRSAVFEKRKRLMLFLFDMIGLMDRTGQLLRARAKFHDTDLHVRSRLVEMIDSVARRALTEPFVLLMEDSDIRSLAAFGNRRWQLAKILGTQYEAFFLRSPNNWIRAVTLFTLQRVHPSIDEAIQVLARQRIADESLLVSQCAAEYGEALA